MKETFLPFFIPDFIYYVVNYTVLHLRCFIDSFYIDIVLKQNKFTDLPQLLVKDPKCLFFLFSRMKKMVVIPGRFRLTVKLISCIAFESASSAFKHI